MPFFTFIHFTEFHDKIIKINSLTSSIPFFNRYFGIAVMQKHNFNLIVN